MLRRGKTFPCADCGRMVVVPKTAVGLAVAGMVALSLWSEHIPYWLIAAMIVSAALIEWLRARVQLAPETMSAP